MSDQACEIVEDEWVQSGAWRRREAWVGYTFFERQEPHGIPGPGSSTPESSNEALSENFEEAF